MHFQAAVLVLAVLSGCGGRTISGSEEQGSATGGTAGDSAASGGKGASTGSSGGNATAAGGGTTGQEPEIACGTDLCDAETMDCCVGANSSACVVKGSCEGVTFSCSSSASCAEGQVCCAHVDLGEQRLESTCRESCGGSDGPTIQFCVSDSECRNGEVCAESYGLQGVCRGNGGPRGAGR